jgi:hypothetical protein
MKIDGGDKSKDPRRAHHPRKGKADNATTGKASGGKPQSVDPLAGVAGAAGAGHVAGGAAGAGPVEEIEPWKVPLTEDELLLAAAIKKQLKMMADDDEPPRPERIRSRPPTNEEVCKAFARHLYEDWREENGLLGEDWTSWNDVK